MSNVERLMALADEYGRTCYIDGNSRTLRAQKDAVEASAALQSAVERLAAPAEPVAWMFFTRHKRTARRDEFAAIDWLPEPDDGRELIEKRPLVYAHPAQPADAPADMVLVPRVPTAAMLDAAMALDKQARDGIAHSYQDLWDAMIAAAKERANG